MRTKALELEKKRYSLRNAEKRDFLLRREEEIVAAVMLESKKQFDESRTSPFLSPQESITVTASVEADESAPANPLEGSTTNTKKRKKAKPSAPLKTTNKKQKTYHGENIEAADYHNDLHNGLQTTTQQQQAQTQDQQTEFNPSAISAPPTAPKPTQASEISIADISSALSHSINCKEVSSACNVPECVTAKQFLKHCSTCQKTNCITCKAMVTLVYNHAQICEVPLDICCPIPNCDKERLMVLQEWVKLKHKHNEMMDVVFRRGLMHALTCTDKNCDDLGLCKNVKAILQHGRICKKDVCKTKKFVKKLCRHHQQECNREDCDVEFCMSETERLKKKREAEHLKKKREAEREQLKLLQQQQFANAGNTTMPDLQHHSTFVSPGGGAGTGVPNNMCTVPLWAPNLVPMTQPPQPPPYVCFYPPPPMNYPNPYLSFNPNATSTETQEMYNPDLNLEKQQVDAQHQHVEIDNEPSVPNDNPITYNPDHNDETENHITITEEVCEAGKQHDNLYVAGSTENVSQIPPDMLSYKPSPPNQEMYYRFWAEKGDGSKRGSPNDFQMLSQNTQHQQYDNLLSLMGDKNCLSPINDNRVLYPEMQPQPQEFLLPNSQEEEDEEPEDPLAQSCLTQEEKHGYSTTAIQPHSEEQQDWGRIDFMNQSTYQHSEEL